MVGSDLASLFHGVGEELARRPGDGALDSRHDLSTHAQVAERGREPDQGDETLHQHERRDKGQRARVAEAVGSTQAGEGVLEELYASRVEQRLASVVARELPCLRNLGGGAHASLSAGTQTVIASGSTSTSSFFTFLRSPPSSS